MIEPVQFSDWAAPLVPVVKEDGGVCICRHIKLTINQASQLHTYHLPCMEDLFDILAGEKTSTKLNKSHANQQLLLDDESMDDV